jgi:hypothetical protein
MTGPTGPYGDHPEPAVLQATLSTQLLSDGYRNTTFTMAAKRSEAAVSLVALQQLRPALVPWDFDAGPVPCSDRQRVSLEPAVQSRTEMLQKSALKTYLMPRNLGPPHTPPRRARALA